MGLLLLPKALALGQWLTRARGHRGCRGFGGTALLLRSAALELVLSVLFAPILMLQQTKTILGLCAGATIGWAPQNRGHGRYDLATLLGFHWLETGLGLGLLAGIAAGALPLWLLPVAVPLAGAVALSHLSARPMTHPVARPLLRTPQDRARTPVQRRLVEARAAVEQHARYLAQQPARILPARAAKAKARMLELAAE